MDGSAGSRRPDQEQGVQIERAARALLRRAHTARFLGTFLRHGTVALFVAGGLALLARSVWSLSPVESLWVLALLPLAVLTAWLHARNSRLSLPAAAAWLDVRAGGTGILVTGAEAPDARWVQRVHKTMEDAPSQPRLTFGRAPGGLLAGAVFTLLALLVPVPEAVATPSVNEIFERTLDDLAEELETLQEEISLEEVVAEELEERLESLRDEVDAEDPEGAFEAKDRLEESLAEEAERAREQALAAQESMREAAHDAEQGDAESTESNLTEALESLARAGMEQLAKEALESALAGLENLDSEALADAARKLDSDALRQIAEALAGDPSLAQTLDAELAKLLEGKLGRLADAGLLKDAPLLSKDQLRSLAELAQELSEHTCDSDCPPGGT